MSRPDFRYHDRRYRAFEPSHVAPYGALCNTQPTARLITTAAGRPSTPMPDLKLIALDAEDLGVISAHLQDAVLRVGDMVYLPNEKRFVALANRFDWAKAKTPPSKSRKTSSDSLERRRAGLRFERVNGAKVQGFDFKDKKTALALLAVTFEPALSQNETPEGDVTLTFSGGAAIRLSVECIEAELKDLGAAWTAKRSPEHPEDAS
jgi:hypothetical protein